MKSETKNVAVIGSGLGGLTAACTAAARGHKVVVYDKNSWAGGKAAVLNQDGYRFDMGPTILTLPKVLKRVFDEANKEMSDYLEMVPLDPQWRCFYEDGEVLDLVSDVAAMKKELDRFSNEAGEAERYEEFIKISEQLHEISKKFYFWKSVGGVGDTMNLKKMVEVKVLKDLFALRMGKSMAGTVRKYAHDERVAQMLDHFTQYVGSSPMGSPAVLCGIAHMQVEEGIWYPMGGTRAVPEALVKLAGDLGVEFKLNAEVTKIKAKNGRAYAVVSDEHGEEAYDSIISNSDSVRTFNELVDGGLKKPFVADRYEPACSGVVLYLGLNKRYEHIQHHNFVFSRNAEEEFDAIYKQGIPAPDPTCYLCAPAMTEPAMAPDGGEALYVLVHTPYLHEGQDWNEMLPGYRQVILDKLKRCAGMEDIEERIVTEAHLTPQDIHDRYRVLNGAIYGLASHGLFGGAFKPANQCPWLDGLYLCGGAAHPGPGMPMVMMSGWIAADCLDKDAAPAVAAVV